MTFMSGCLLTHFVKLLPNIWILNQALPIAQPCGPRMHHIAESESLLPSSPLAEMLPLPLWWLGCSSGNRCLSGSPLLSECSVTPKTFEVGVGVHSDILRPPSDLLTVGLPAGMLGTMDSMPTVTFNH